MGRSLTIVAVTVASLFAATAAHAAVVLDAGDHVLVTQQPQQTFAIDIIGGDSIAGLILALQIGDGTAGPIITDVELELGTIFDGNSGGQNDYIQDDYAIYSDVGTASGTVVADGVTAFVTVDTTGLLPHTSYDILLSDINLGGRDYNSEAFDGEGFLVETTTVAGSLTLIPEPTAGVLLLAAAGATLVRRRRRRVSGAAAACCC